MFTPERVSLSASFSQSTGDGHKPRILRSKCAKGEHKSPFFPQETADLYGVIRGLVIGGARHARKIIILFVLFYRQIHRQMT